MTKQEMIAYGVPEDRVREFSKAYHKDIRELATRDAQYILDKKDVTNLRTAILALVPTLKNADSLRHVLKAVNRAAFAEDWDRKAAAEMREMKRSKEQEVTE